MGLVPRLEDPGPFHCSMTAAAKELEVFNRLWSYP
jgi:hypothetical protein